MGGPARVTAHERAVLTRGAEDSTLPSTSTYLDDRNQEGESEVLLATERAVSELRQLTSDTALGDPAHPGARRHGTRRP